MMGVRNPKKKDRRFGRYDAQSVEIWVNELRLGTSKKTAVGLPAEM
jgi:hypothetical protein